MEVGRYVLLVAALGVGALATGYSFNQGWATQTWPWPDGDFTHLFAGSILAAIAAIGVWVAAVGEWSALRNGGLAVFVMFGGCSAYLFVRATAGQDINYAIGFAAVAAAGATLALAARHVPVRDQRPMPTAVRAAFVAVVAVLLVAGVVLLARVQLFPWAVDDRSTVMFGCVSLGSASYFASSLAGRCWHDARGGLVAVLAYDLVLFPRYVLFPRGSDAYGYPAPTNNAHLPAFIAFISVTGLLAIYYLFVAKRTRKWSIVRSAAVPGATAAGPSPPRPPGPPGPWGRDRGLARGL